MMYLLFTLSNLMYNLWTALTLPLSGLLPGILSFPLFNLFNVFATKKGLFKKMAGLLNIRQPKATAGLSGYVVNKIVKDAQKFIVPVSLVSPTQHFVIKIRSVKQALTNTCIK